MKVVYHKKFIKSYKRLSRNLQEKVTSTIFAFTKNPRAHELSNHMLKGKLDGKRSISVSGDIRIIFEEIDDYILVIFLDVGTHNQLY